MYIRIYTCFGFVSSGCFILVKSCVLLCFVLIYFFSLSFCLCICVRAHMYSCVSSSACKQMEEQLIMCPYRACALIYQLKFLHFWYPFYISSSSVSLVFNFVLSLSLSLSLSLFLSLSFFLSLSLFLFLSFSLSLPVLRCFNIHHLFSSLFYSILIFPRLIVTILDFYLFSLSFHL